MSPPPAPSGPALIQPGKQYEMRFPMDITITPSQLKGVVTPPPSKSQAHRLLLAAALAQGESVISNVALSQDIAATIRCLEELGAHIRIDGSTATVQGIAAGPMSPLRRIALPHLDCGESGSTLRFLIPVALAVRGGGIFTGRGRLMERPLTPYFHLFRKKGISWQQEDGTLTISGLLTPGDYPLPGDVSSQFFTGLLFALPLLRGDSRIVLTSPLESEDYVTLTRQAMEAAGVLVSGWEVPGGQFYQPVRQTVEADWSQAAFWYAAQTLGSDLVIPGLNPFSSQPDARVAALCQQLAGRQPDLAIDVSQYPDLFPALALMAAARPGLTTRIRGGARLRIKESDRIAAVADVLTRLGVWVEEFPDGIRVAGVIRFAGGVELDCHNDHRIAMMLAIAATRCEKPITLLGAECVNKSYPTFWEDYESLGGQISRREG